VLVRIEIVGYEHPDAQRLIGEVQQEYVVRYGEEDSTPVDAAQFAPPHGLFLLVYLEGRAVACGGWRVHDGDEPDFEDGDTEIKRMYVAPDARGRGLARALLAELEHTAALAGRKRVVLETGQRQPEAIALYRSSGYREIAKFGVYRQDPDSVCFAKEI
jgi:ribosomal protein S18 acetylase RimI-like enzyme